MSVPKSRDQYVPVLGYLSIHRISQDLESRSNQICNRLLKNAKGNCTQKGRSGADSRHARWLTRKWRYLLSCSIFMLPAQFIGHPLVDRSGHVSSCLSNNVLSEYWRIHLDYHNQWLEAVAHVPHTLATYYLPLPMARVCSTGSTVRCFPH